MRARQVARSDRSRTLRCLEVPQDFEGLREFFRGLAMAGFLGSCFHYPIALRCIYTITLYDYYTIRMESVSALCSLWSHVHDIERLVSPNRPGKVDADLRSFNFTVPRAEERFAWFLWVWERQLCVKFILFCVG